MEALDAFILPFQADEIVPTVQSFINGSTIDWQSEGVVSRTMYQTHKLRGPAIADWNRSLRGFLPKIDISGNGPYIPVRIPDYEIPFLLQQAVEK